MSRAGSESLVGAFTALSELFGNVRDHPKASGCYFRRPRGLHFANRSNSLRRRTHDAIGVAVWTAALGPHWRETAWPEAEAHQFQNRSRRESAVFPRARGGDIMHFTTHVQIALLIVEAKRCTLLAIPCQQSELSAAGSTMTHRG